MRLILTLTLLSGCFFYAEAQGPGRPASYRVLVQPRLGADDGTVVAAIGAAGGRIEHTISSINVHVIQAPTPALGGLRQALERSGLFTFVEADAVGQAITTPTDPSFASQWHLSKIQAPASWDLATGSLSSPVAVIDSGVDGSHADLASKMTAGWNFVASTSNTSDVNGHGTAVAGTIGAATNNAIGVAGVSWLNPIMPLLVTDSGGYAYYSTIASAITYAADHGARVINISIAGTSPSSTLQSAVDYAWNKGAVVFAAAGNSSSSTVNYPAGCNNAVAVSATSSSDTLSSFSNFGNWIDLAAPGEYILTTMKGGGYGAWSGTSFASPVTAGVAALVLSMRPSLSASGLVSLLKQNADDLGPAGSDTSFGAGRVNAYRSVSAAASYAGDVTAPAVSISSPASGASVSGIISVSGAATDQTGVIKIECLVDGGVISTLSVSTVSASYSCAWNTASNTNGGHNVAVKAYDAAGNVGQSSVVVTVNNPVITDTTPPTVAITSPANGSTLPMSVKVAVQATDNVAVTQVSVYLDGVLQYTGTAAPYSFSLNTKKLSKGSHTFTAKAWDKAGNTTSATPVTVYK